MTENFPHYCISFRSKWEGPQGSDYRSNCHAREFLVARAPTLTYLKEVGVYSPVTLGYLQAFYSACQVVYFPVSSRYRV
jgi:hypothetical protein